MLVRRSLALFFACVLLPASAALANVAPAASREEVKKKLETFFARMDDKSPSALRKISQSPATLKEIDQRIESMSDADVAEFQKLMAEVPDWQTAPQAIAKMLPPEAMKTIDKASADFTKRAPRAERTRNDIATLATVLKMLPDAKLKELGITREMVGSLDGAMNQISPLQAGVLEQQLGKDASWQAKSDAALSALPPALQKGAAALAKHGPLTALDKIELETYRTSLTDVLRRVDALPDDMKKEFKIADLAANIQRFEHSSLEVIFMMREQTPPAAVQKLSDTVGIFEKAATLTPDERQALEKFRTEFADTFAQMQPDHPDEKLQKSVASMSTADLLMLKKSMPDIDDMHLQLPILAQTITDRDFEQRVNAVKQPDADPALVASLESFRQQTLDYIASLSNDSTVTPELAESARQGVQSAKLPVLELMRSASARIPQSTSAASRLKIVANLAHVSFDCTFTIHTPDPLPNIDVDLNFICNPIASAINSVIDLVGTAINDAVSVINSTINTIRDGLNTAINAVSDTVNSIVNGLVNTANQIWSFIQTIPDLAWNAIKSAFNALLDLNLGGGLTVRTLISGGISQVVPALQSALNLGEGFWNSLNGTLPQIPCPPAGFATPFGAVGTDDAAAKYNHYAFFLDKIFGLIPSDVFSLEVKIPAQVLYAAWQYLGVCLQEAANAKDAADAAALADQRFTTLTTGITNLGNQAGNNTILTIAEVDKTFAALQTLTTNDDAALTTLITNKFADLTSLIKQNAADAHDLDLRLAIEADLQGGPPNGLVMFQLPKANGGYLETVEQIVNDDISNVLATGQSIGQAQKFFSDGLTAMSSGRFKDAFKAFQKAYSELAK